MILLFIDRALLEQCLANISKSPSPDLTRNSHLSDIKFPASRRAFYFMGASKVILHKKNGKWTGYQPVYRNLEALGVDDNKSKWIYGEVVEYRELFEHCYRTKVCTNCGKEQLASVHDWKERGAEGPFEEIWGTRDSFCKECRSKKKANAYKQKVRMQKRRQRLCEAFRPFVIGSLSNSAIQNFSKVLLLAIRDSKDGDADGKTRQKGAEGTRSQDRS